MFSDKSNNRDMMKKEDQILGLAKLLGFLECLSIHPMLSGFEGEEATEATVSSQQMTIFAHHNIEGFIIFAHHNDNIVRDRIQVSYFPLLHIEGFTFVFCILFINIVVTCFCLRCFCFCQV